MIKGLAMPYMGSKRKLAPEILNYIIRQNPNCKYFYDLFGGGGASDLCYWLVQIITGNKKAYYKAGF